MKFSLCAQHNIPEVLDDISCTKIGLRNNIYLVFNIVFTVSPFYSIFTLLEINLNISYFNSVKDKVMGI
jgi:hypothetical protein